MDVRHFPVSSFGIGSHKWAQMAACCGPLPRISFPPVRVLVAGDHPSLRSSLRTVLEMDPRITVIGEASDDCEMVKMSKRLKPDVVLMDLDMRCCDSFEAVSEISKRKLAGTIIGLTIHDDNTERAAAQKAGVTYFLEKGVSLRQMADTIRKAASTPAIP